MEKDQPRVSSQQLVGDSMGLEGKRAGAPLQLVPRTLSPPPGCYSKFWLSLWLELPILDLAGDSSGQAFVSLPVCVRMRHMGSAVS